MPKGCQHTATACGSVTAIHVLSEPIQPHDPNTSANPSTETQCEALLQLITNVEAQQPPIFGANEYTAMGLGYIQSELDHAVS